MTNGMAANTARDAANQIPTRQIVVTRIAILGRKSAAIEAHSASMIWKANALGFCAKPPMRKNSTALGSSTSKRVSTIKNRSSATIEQATAAKVRKKIASPSRPLRWTITAPVTA